MHSPQVSRHLGWNLGLSFNYAKDPLNFLRPRSDEFIYEMVKNQLTFDVMGAIALYERFEIGLALPITSQSSASTASVSPLLKQVAQVLRANPQLTKVRVEGHTDSQGNKTAKGRENNRRVEFTIVEVKEEP